MTDAIDALCTSLTEAGIDLVFGVPGTQNVALFDGFRRHGIRAVLASHELAAAFMANGHFRATGRMAALATIPGPGFTFALTGIAEARLDSAAILYLVGKPATEPGQRFQLQAIDQRAIAGPLLKGTFALGATEDPGQVVREASDLATRGEPGPVMIELDLEALARRTTGEEPAASAPAPTSAAPLPDGERVRELQRLFERAERPLFLLGQGAFGCATRLEAVAAALTIPILTTPTARGIVAEDHELVLGFDPLRGHTSRVNELIDQSDLLIVLGAKLGHNGTAGFELRLPSAHLVQVDAEASVVEANYPVLLGIAARVEEVMGALESRRAPTGWSVAELAAARAALRAANPDAVEPRIRGTRSMMPKGFFASLRRSLPRDAIVVTDSGLHQILTRRHFDVLAPRGLIVPSDFQSMGFGLPAAIGAKLGAPQRVVVAIVGDGGFLMSGLEMLTARREHAPLVVFVFNDGHLNQIRLQQMRSTGRPHAVTLLNPDFHALSIALGLEYIRFEQDAMEEIAGALRGDVPVLVEVVVADSVAMRTLPAINRAKEVARAALGPRLREWLRDRLRGRRSA